MSVFEECHLSKDNALLEVYISRRPHVGLIRFIQIVKSVQWDLSLLTKKQIYL